METTLYKNQIINKIIIDIYKKRISNLLYIIYLKYPNKFKKENIDLEFNYIVENIMINIIKPTDMVKNENNKLKMVIKKKEAKCIELNERCIARVWNSIFDRKTCKEITDIDENFKVNDYNDIDNVKFFNRYIVGSRCSRKFKTESKYCIFHSKHSPHGEFNKIPSKELCFHFIKNGNYI